VYHASTKPTPGTKSFRGSTAQIVSVPKSEVDARIKGKKEAREAKRTARGDGKA